MVSSSDRVTNWYRELGVPARASAAEIKAAYRRRARATHTDVTGADASAFARVSQAYEVLSDPQRRAAHDAELAAHGWHAGALVPVRPPAASSGPAPAPSAVFPPARRRPARAPAPGPRYRVGRWMAWVWLAMVAGNAARFTGVPAEVFGFRRGERMLVGGPWWTVPAVDVAADASTVFALLAWGAAVAVIAVVPVTVWTWRVGRRPVPRLEAALALAGLFAAGSAWEVLLVRSAFWHVLAVAVIAWLVWVAALSCLPSPVGQPAWDRFGTWVSQLAAARAERRRKPGSALRTLS